jgi:PAS domain S-box-containing protein
MKSGSDEDNVIRIDERRAQRELDREIFERIFIDSPFPVQIIEPGGMPRRHNDAHAAFVGAFGARVGIGSFNVLSDRRSERSGHAKHHRRAFQGEVVDYEFSAAIADGVEESWFERLLVPITAVDGRVTAVVSVIMDITERKRLEDERIRLNEQLLHAQKLESLGVLAGGIAHDFNNLLVAVLGNASLLANRLPPGSPLLEYAQGIEVAARRAADVAHQMLAYSGKGRFVTALVDVTALLEETADLLRIGAARNVTLVRELRHDLPKFKADPTQVRQVVMNLLTNASEAFDGNSGHIVLRTGVMDVDHEFLASCMGGGEATPGRFVYIEVTDYGVGMTPEIVEKIFDPFFTTKFTGRGLGLAAVFGIVRGHRGAISVESRLGEGTTFRVLFPAEASDGVEASDVRRTAESTPPSSRADRRQASGLALVVDDERAVRRIARRMLETLGFSVVEVAHGEGAVEILEERHREFAVVLMNVSIPHIGGRGVLDALRERSIAIPVILASGYEMGSAELQGLGPDVTILPMPFSYDELAGALAAARG